MKSSIASVLNKVLGEFCDNFDTHQLSLSIFSGTIDLVDLHIKSESLDLLGFPFELKHGVIGRMHIDIPWTCLASSPLKVQLSDVFVQLASRPKTTWNIDNQKSLLKKGRLLALENYEMRNLPELQTSGYTEQFITKIIDNLQVNISGIYIRLDDFVSSTAPFSIGIVLGGIEAVTCNSSWEREYIPNSQITYKKAYVNSFSVFLDSCSEDLTDLFLVHAREEIEAIGESTHAYLINPLQLSVKLELNKNLKNLHMPQVRVEMTDCVFQVKLVPTQILHMMKLTEFYFSFDRFIQGVEQSLPQEDFVESVAEQYRRIYRDLRQGDFNKHGILKTILHQMEENVGLDHIKAQRTFVLQEIEYERQEHEKQEEIKELEAGEDQGIFGSLKDFFGCGKSKSQKETQETECAERIETIHSELAEIHNTKLALNSETPCSKTLDFGDFPADYARFVFKINVPLISISLSSDDHVMLVYRVHEVTLELGLRPTSLYTKLEVKGSEVQDFIIASEYYPDILRSERLLAVYDSLPSPSIRVQLDKCFIVVNLDSILEAAYVLRNSALKELNQSRYSKVVKTIADKYGKASADYMSNIFQGNYEPTHIELDIEAQTPTIIFPLDINSNLAFIEIHLGSLKAYSKKAKTQKGVDLKSVTVDEQIYHAYTFEFSNASIETSEDGQRSKLLLLTSIRNTLKTCVVSDHPTKPNFTLSTAVKKVNTSINNAQFRLLIELKTAVMRTVEQRLPSDNQSPSTPTVQILRVESIQAMKRVVTIVCDFKVSEFVFNLYKQSLHLLNGRMKNLRADLALAQDGEVKMDLDLRSVMLKDMQEGAAFNKIFYNPAKGKSQLTVTAVLNPKKESMKVLVTMNDFRVVLCPGIVGALIEFGELQGNHKPSQQLGAKVDEESNYVSAQPAKERLSKPKLFASLQIINFEIWLPTSSAQVLCLGLSSAVSIVSLQHILYRLTPDNEIVDACLKLKDNEITLDVTQLTVKSGTGASYFNSQPKALLRPCRLSLSINDNKHDDEESQTFELLMETVSLELGFNDCLDFYKLAANWQQVRDFFAADKHKWLDKIKQPTRYSEVFRDAKVQSDSIKIVFIDDAHEEDGQLFMIEISNFGSSALMYEGLKLSATVEFFASYYNPVVCAWEPFIEPYAIELAAIQASPSEQMSIKLRSNQIQKFNITYSMCKAFTILATQILQGENVGAIKSIMPRDMEDPQEPELTIGNLLGEDIEIYFDSCPKETKKTLLHGEKYSITATELRQMLSTHGKSYSLSTIIGVLKPPLTMSFQLAGLFVVEGVNVERVGTNGFQLKGPGESSTVIVEVTNQKWRKCVNIISNCLVMNNTDFAIEVTNLPHTAQVSPHTSWNMPISWTVGKPCLVTDLDPLPLEVNHNSSFVKVNNCWVSLDILKVDAIEGELTVVQVNPAVTLINLLPGFLSIYQNDIEICTLSPGEEAQADRLDPTDSFSLTLKLRIDETKEISSSITSPPRLDVAAYHEVTGSIPVEKIVSVRSLKLFEHNQDLSLKYKEVHSTSVSAQALILYLDYLIINRANFNIEVGSGNDLIAVNKYSFGALSTDRKEVRLRLSGDEYGNPTAWSKHFNIATVGVAGIIKLKNALANSANAQAPKRVDLGVVITDANFPLVKTKIVQIVPRFIVNNTLNTPVYLRQFERTEVIQIEAKSQVVFNLTDPSAQRSIQVSEDNKTWSSAFNIEEVEDFVVKMTSTAQGAAWHAPGPHNFSQRFYRVAVTTLNDATLYINLLTPIEPEFIISNKTDEAIEVRQRNCSPWVIEPRTSVPYAYDNLMDNKKKIFVTANMLTKTYSLENVEQKKPLGRYKVELVIDGVKRVLTICEPDNDEKNEKVRGGFNKTLNKVDIELDLEGLGISIIDEEPKEVVYVSLSQLLINAEAEWVFSITSLEVKQALTVNIGHAQVDNMLTHKDAFPVLMCPKAKQSSEVPFFQMNIHKTSVKSLFQADEKALDRFQLVGLLIQEMQVQVDMQTILQLHEVVNSVFKATDKLQPDSSDIYQIVPELSAQQPCTDMSAKSASNKCYFEVFQLSAIKVLLSFKMYRKKLQLDTNSGFVHSLMNIGEHLANFSNSPLYFKNLICFSSFQTVETFANLIVKNYMRQGIMQFYKILGSSDVLGNPIGLIDNLGNGVVEFFSEPYRGLLKGPGEFAGGVVKGVKALIAGVISGSFGSISKITGSLYSIVREVGGDEEGAYRLKRSDNALMGIVHGIKGGVIDIAEGLSGIVTKPYRGAKKAGVAGFFKGFGRGMLGAAISPFSAVLRVGSSFASGISNAGEFLKSGRITQKGRTRFPRHFPSSRVLTPYDQGLAEAQEWLRVNGKFSYENLVLFLKFQSRTIAMLTDCHFLVIFKGEVDRAVPIMDITKCEVHKVHEAYFLCASAPGLAELVVKSKDINKIVKLFFAVASMAQKLDKTDLLHSFKVPARYAKPCCC